MALKITSLVWERGPKDLAQFLVLLTLADFADASGLCWPSIETIAERSRLSKSSMYRAMKQLETGGWYSTVRKSREHKGNTYKISLDRLISGVTVTPDLFESSVTVTPETPKSGVTVGKSGVTRGKSGVTAGKPPDPLKGGTTKNHHEPKTKGAPFVAPAWLPLDSWSSYLEMRKKRRRYPTEKAIGLVVKKLDQLRASGQDPGAVLDQSTRSDWIDVYELRSSNGTGNGGKLSPGAARFDGNKAAVKAGVEAFARRSGIALEDDSGISEPDGEGRNR